MDSPPTVDAPEASDSRDPDGSTDAGAPAASEAGALAAAATDSGSPASAADRRALGLILLAALAAFWPTIASFPPTWNASYQEHGFFVGALVLWLVWRDRHRVVETAERGIPDLLPVVGLISIGWLFAVIMNTRLVHQLAFWAVATVATLAIFGWKARRPILATSATFLLAIPFWSVLRPPLQRMTTVMSGAIGTLGGVEAEIGYDYIALSAGTLLVEEGCSGINYLMGGLVLGAFYAHLFARRWQTQVKIVALAGAMSIVGNWIRVAVLVFLAEATAMQSPYIEDHLWQGWAIFTLLMIPTYVLARRIEEADAERSEAAATGVGWAAEPTAVGPAAGPAAAESMGAVPEAAPLRRRAVRTSFVAVAGPILFFVLGAIPRGGDLDRSSGIFTLADGWSLTETSDGWAPDFHGFDERTAWAGAGPAGTLQAARYYYQDQRQGEELIQYDNRIAPDSLVALDRIIGPVGPERRFVREAVVRDRETPRVVWYWYRVAGFDTPFEVKAKLLEILAFFRRHPAAELVVVDAECAPEDCTGAATTLRAAFGLPTEAPTVEP